MKKSDMTGASPPSMWKSCRSALPPIRLSTARKDYQGVNIMKSGGNAGAGVQVKIRGGNLCDNEPLTSSMVFRRHQLGEPAGHSGDGGAERLVRRQPSMVR